MKKLEENFLDGESGKMEKLDVVLLFLIWGLLSAICFMLYDGDNQINMNNITEEQYGYILNAMMDLKPGYRDKINNLTFSSNQTWIADQCNSDKKLINNLTIILYGCHTSDNEIFVWINSNRDEDYFRKILCHEILHEIIEIELDEEEELAYLIDDSLICFNESRLKVNNIDLDFNNSKLFIIRRGDFGKEQSENPLRWG